MPHRARTHTPGGTYYALLSGSGGRRIFLSEEDKESFGAILTTALKRYAAQVHAYCWGERDVRMIVEIADVPLGRIVQAVAAPHARWMHRRARQAGHLFKHPYRSALLEGTQQLIETARHIHFAPLDFTPPIDPAEYTWSSHRAYLGIEQPQAWLTTGRILQSLTPDRTLQRVAYRDLFQPPQEASLPLAPSREERFLQVPPPQQTLQV